VVDIHIDVLWDTPGKVFLGTIKGWPELEEALELLGE
jgi:hypothetical protein